MMDRSKIVAAAERHHAAGRIQQATTLYRDLLEADPHDVEALIGLGIAALQERRTDEALDLLGTAATVAPGSPSAAANLGMAYMLSGRRAEAEDCLRRAVRLDPENEDAATALAQLRAQEGDLEAAEAILRQAAEARPDSPNVVFALSSLTLQRGDRRSAEALLRRSLELDPANEMARSNLGVLLGESGRPDEAAALFEELLLDDPTNAAFAVNANQAFIRTGRAGESEKTLRRVLSTQPKSPQVREALGHALMAQGRVREAVKCFGETLRALPDSETAAFNMTVALRHTGLADAAVATARRLVDLAAEPAAHRTLLADCLMADGQWADAWSLLAGPDGAPVPDESPAVWRFGGLDRDALAALRCLPASGAGTRPVLQVPPVFQGLFQRLAGIRATVETVGEAHGGGPAVWTPLGVLAANGPGPEDLPLPPAVARPTGDGARRARRIAVIPMVDGAPGWVAAGKVPAAMLVEAALVLVAELLMVAPGGPPGAGWDHLDPYATDPLAMLEALTGCDLVIGGDNVLCHLAAYAGVPVHLLLPSFADGRWGAAGETTPWYPGMRLFRQPAPGDWETPVRAAVARAAPL